MSVTPLASATVVVLRDSPAGPEVLMVRRHEKAGDFAGLSVFPGGIVESEDADPALAAPATGFLPESALARLGEAISAEEAAALHVAGCRELFEEAALLLARAGAEGIAAELGRFRRELVERRATFRQMMDALGLTLALDSLRPIARWITPEHQPRRWDARFFLALAPDGQEAECDGEETSEVAWLRPAAALDAYRAGEHLLAPPTFRVLEDLTAFVSVGAAFAHARDAVPPRPILPVPLPGAGTLTMVYPGDRDYPGGTGTGWNRLTLHEGHWKSRR